MTKNTSPRTLAPTGQPRRNPATSVYSVYSVVPPTDCRVSLRRNVPPALSITPGLPLSGLKPHRSPVPDASLYTPPSSTAQPQAPRVPPTAPEIPAPPICQRPGCSPTRQKPNGSERFPVVASGDSRYNHKAGIGSMPIRRKLVPRDACKGESAPLCPGRFAGGTVSKDCCGQHDSGDQTPFRALW